MELLFKNSKVGFVLITMFVCLFADTGYALSESSVSSISEMKALSNIDIANVVSGTGIDGKFYWDSASTATEDGGTVFDDSTPGGVGRWVRIYSGAVNVLWFGVKNDGTSAADNTSKLQSIIEDFNSIYFPAGIYAIDDELSFNQLQKKTIRGAGKALTTIKYVGSDSNDSVLLMASTAYNTIRDIGVDANFTAKYGIKVFDDTGATPTVTIQNVLESIAISNCVATVGCGLFVGCEGNWQVSENTFRTIKFSNCYNDIVNDSQQTIRITYEDIVSSKTDQRACGGVFFDLKGGQSNFMEKVWVSSNTGTFFKVTGTADGINFKLKDAYFEAATTVLELPVDASHLYQTYVEFENVNIGWSGAENGKIIDVQQNCKIKLDNVWIRNNGSSGKLYINPASSGIGGGCYLLESFVTLQQGITRDYTSTNSTEISCGRTISVSNSLGTFLGGYNYISKRKDNYSQNGIQFLSGSTQDGVIKSVPGFSSLGWYTDDSTILAKSYNGTEPGLEILRLRKQKGLFTAVPATGTWEHGDIVFNAQPQQGGSIGWVCVSSGTPGTWKKFGNIEN
jgi:hypothetical protein